MGARPSGSWGCRTGSWSGWRYRSSPSSSSCCRATTGYFHWGYWWWNVPFVLPIVVFGYLWFFLVGAYVYDMRHTGRRASLVGAMSTLVAAALPLFGFVLEWI